MAGEGLLEAAGQNFKQAGDTTIASQRAQTEKESTQNEPRMRETSEIHQDLRAAMGDKARMKEIQEQKAAEIQIQLLKGKMGETSFPPELAIQMAKEFKDPSIMQMAGMPMNNRLLGAWIAEKYKASMKNNQPKFNGNMMVTKDADGNDVLTDLTKFGFHYRPSGGGKGGGSNSPDAMDFKKKKEFLRAYEKLRSYYSDPLRAEMERKTHPDKYDADMQKIKDDQDTYDSIMKEMSKGSGGAPKPSDDGAASPGSNGPTLDKDALFKDL